MNLKLADLMKALPEERTTGDRVADSLPRPEQIMEVLVGLTERPTPLGALRRLWALGGLEAYVAFAYLSWWVRGWFMSADARTRRRAETNLRAALKMLKCMVYLRGAVMKAGQLLGSLPDVAPDEFIDTLGHLHFEAPPMHFSLLREQVRNELGRDPEEIFASFETKALAAASLGQVHLARLRSGERVAVKIQYPGIARTIDSDFRSLNALLLPLRFSKDWQNIKEQFESVWRMLRDETDYELEAASMRAAASHFRDEDGIVVPRVYDEYSTRRVLTTEYLDGSHIEAFLATRPSRQVRDRFGAQMYRAAFRLYYGGLNYADPHPGNYIFMPDGRLGLIDFGCVWTFSKEERGVLKDAEATISGDEKIFRELAKRVGRLTDRELRDKERMRLLREAHDWVLEPLRHEGVFDFGDQNHLRRGLAAMAQLVLKRFTRTDPMQIYMYRSFFGLRAMLYRLRARVDVRALHDAECRKLK